MYQPNWKMPEQKPKKLQPAQPAREPTMASRVGTWWKKSKLRSRWQKNKRFLIIAAVVIIGLLIVFALAVYIFGWDWTGFNGGYSAITTTSTSRGTTTATVKPPGKTLWDLLQLLIIPLVLAVGGYLFN